MAIKKFKKNVLMKSIRLLWDKIGNSMNEIR